MPKRNPNPPRQAHRAPNPRRAVLEILALIFQQRRTYEQAFEAHPFAKQLADWDRHWLRHVVMAVLRHRFALQAAVSPFLAKKIPQKHVAVQYALWAGAAELYLMEVPGHAVVHEWVEVIKHSPSNHMKGLVNAVLRRLAEQPERWDEAQTTPPRGWLWQSWEAAYGAEATAAIANMMQRIPPLDLTCTQDGDQWAQKLGGELLPNGSVRLQEAGDVTQLEGFQDGTWWVQDAAASLPVQLLGNVKNKRVLDLCAAPGGKTAQLANAGAQVTALDRSKNRMQRLQENLQRVRLGADTVVADALTWEPEGHYDAILLDAPCSATGTIRRHPELPFIKRKEDVVEMQAIQQSLLAKASAWLNPGGVLLYCVCSLQPEEGEAQIAAALADDATLSRDPIHAEALPYGVQPGLNGEGELRTLPFFWQEQGGMDGFFIARLIKDRG